MSTCEKWLVILACGVVVLSGRSGLGLSAVAQQASDERSGQAIAVHQTPRLSPAEIDDLPDSPGAALAQEKAPMLAQIAQSQPDVDEAASRQGVGDQSGAIQAPPNQSTNNPGPPQRPVGTAAAGAPTTTGVAASEPAGVAIAPAKQHRARTIIIRTGAIIGAAVAVGVVVGLTEATGSKPPGAH
jgi:hypothetical protein